jgi:hypothetical protein
VVTVVIEAMVVRWGPSSERTKERGATTPERHKEGKALGIPPVRRAIGPGLFLSATNIRPIAFIFFFFLLFFFPRKTIVFFHLLYSVGSIYV